MTGFEPGSSGIGSYRSVNCATTTAHIQVSWENFFLRHGQSGQTVRNMVLQKFIKSKFKNYYDVHFEFANFAIKCLKPKVGRRRQYLE